LIFVTLIRFVMLLWYLWHL